MICNKKQYNKQFKNIFKHYPIKYNNDNFTIKNTIKKNLNVPHVDIIDVGCGYGGLLYNICKNLKGNSLALGMEIRDKVTN